MSDYRVSWVSYLSSTSIISCVTLQTQTWISKEKLQNEKLDKKRSLRRSLFSLNNNIPQECLSGERFQTIVRSRTNVSDTGTDS